MGLFGRRQTGGSGGGVLPGELVGRLEPFGRCQRQPVVRVDTASCNCWGLSNANRPTQRKTVIGGGRDVGVR